MARPVGVAAALVTVARSAGQASAAERAVHAWSSSTRRAVVSIEVDIRHGGVAGGVAAVVGQDQAGAKSEVAHDATQLGTRNRVAVRSVTA